MSTEKIVLNKCYFQGNKKLIEDSPIIVYCSKEIPLSVYYTANTVFTELLKLPLTVAGGWQSPMEKRVLKNYKNEYPANIVCCLAKGMENFRLPRHLRPLMEDGKLLVISPFQNKARISRRSVMMRDELAFDLIQRFFFLYINQGGYLESILRRCMDTGKKIYFLAHHANTAYLVEGVQPVNAKNMQEVLIG
jgi:hypothetical protein